jgi:predicted nucleic acid-binding protein
MSGPNYATAAGPNINVRNWAETMNPADLYLSVVTVFELERGRILRKAKLSRQVQQQTI